MVMQHGPSLKNSVLDNPHVFENIYENTIILPMNTLLCFVAQTHVVFSPSLQPRF
jgi:hypothetical protein